MTIYNLNLIILNQSVVSCLVLTIASWPAERFLRRQVRTSSIPISKNYQQFVVVHKVKWSRNRCFFLKNLVTFSLIQQMSQFDLWFSAFPKPSLYIWKFSVHVLQTPHLKDFEHNLSSMWNKRNYDHSQVFQICWHTEYSILTASFLGFLNCSAGILSSPLALFVGMLLRPTWLHTLGCPALGEWPHHCGSLSHYDLSCISLLFSVYSCQLLF